MIRILLADSSVTGRRLLLDLFSADPAIATVGEAGDGNSLVAMTKRLRPDVVVMDIDGPGMNGFDTTKRIMIEAPTPIVIVSSAPSERQVELSILALRAGALTVLPRPPEPVSAAEREQRQRFAATVKAMAEVKVVRHWGTRDTAPRARATAEVRPQRHSRVVAIAASTGGPAALQTLLGQLPTEFPAPILVVQHIAGGFIAGFTTWLNTVCSLRVKVAEAEETLEPRTVYVAPDNRHLGLLPNWTVLLSAAPPLGGFRPSATFLFQSVAQAAGRAVTAIILTGMGRDGVDGLSFVRERGGFVIAQDEATSVVFGMPAAAIAANQVDAILPLPAIAPQLLDMV
ncbi:MAG TPA: chemotaxis-specific protein-glutamate methyltransferase CheB [Hypericibacter adhaerens]|jgi:two-component system chemotaxis response regulator CheB|uniref:Protein-glutamate methylesterase/protein-glutamine glutaminase n=1 Tax=Hypericibacter adhaerens TaxID=2602016 RepID=A0A5J6MUX7_9PROT|nr:chemotaxis-specific protein-glutamate methyltransferase CheB [Hypericibacter adhaerens]QEX21071.1 chemotaxis response regulator protein-glutamate methylesterase of group 3 operon [Hypericibacter adhaerens]HWA46385.1 chemotaxis-specific protein-glutamate methyltransferase CheB [Hypericibacter adhaerens]